MHRLASRVGTVWVLLSGLSGCTNSIELTLQADVSDGATGVAKLDFGGSNRVGWSYQQCFSAGVCEMVLGPESVHGGRAELFAWADPENDSGDDPEFDEPTGARTLDVPQNGVLEITLDLE